MIPLGILGAAGWSSSQPIVLAYWDPLKKHASMTLSEENERRVNGNSGSWAAALSVVGHGAGKRYVEIQQVGSSSWEVLHGLVGVGQALNNVLTTGAPGFAWQVGSTSMFGSGVHTPGPSPLGSGGYSRWAYEAATGKVWLGTDSGWLRGGDPSAGTLPTGTVEGGTVLYAAAGIYGSGHSCRLRVAPDEMKSPIPAGFSAWAA